MRNLYQVSQKEVLLFELILWYNQKKYLKYSLEYHTFHAVYLNRTRTDLISRILSLKKLNDTFEYRKNCKGKKKNESCFFFPVTGQNLFTNRLNASSF